MYKELGIFTLKTGERATAGVVLGPDAEWAERLEKLLEHKGDMWKWQNSQALKSNLGIEARFYVLHRDGVPFANILTSEFSGVGMLGHVWTKPEDRRQSACSGLMERQMEDFKSRQGRALLLGTGFDSTPYHIYRRFGFTAVEPQSNYMEWYAESKADFEASYFAYGETTIEPLAWVHWPSSAALFLGDFACVVRCALARLIGRGLPEGPLLPLLRGEESRRARGEHPRAMVLRNKQTSAVVGFTAWGWHPLWFDTCVLDIYCHPNYWDQARNLLGALSLPDAGRTIAYCDANCALKSKVLLDQGFKKTATLNDWVPVTSEKSSFLDVAVFEKHSEPL